MGFFWQGLPPYLIPWAKDLLPGRITAVETGTFQGDTSALLAAAFEGCVTIERSATLAADARRRFADDPRVTVLEGSSRELLADALPGGDSSCFLWLDAHGMYDYAGPDRDENPLLSEIADVLRLRPDAPNVIAVDDARGMGVQPDWPSLASVFGLLDDGGYESAIVDDVLVAAPRSLHADWTGLYARSRVVEVSAVFHIWPAVMRASRIRALSDRVVTDVRSRVRR